MCCPGFLFSLICIEHLVQLQHSPWRWRLMQWLNSQRVKDYKDHVTWS